MPRKLKQNRLLALLDDSGNFVSGELLSRQLGVSRTAVWKQVENLRHSGYSIEAVTSRGYRLLGYPDFLDADSISAILPRGMLVGQQIISLAETASTNTEAFRLAEAGTAEGTVVIADRQTAGKGRLGRQWVSPPGVNLYLSLILRPSLPPYEAPQLTFISAVALARAIELETGLAPAIKWPNDLLIGNAKVAGLLNEMSAETDRVSFVILGIGLNINMGADQFPEGLRSPSTSLSLQLGRKISRKLMVARLLATLDEEYKNFLDHGFEHVREEWSRRCNAFGRQISVENGSTVLRGPFCGIDHDGALLVESSSGHIERIMSGDVTVY